MDDIRNSMLKISDNLLQQCYEKSSSPRNLNFLQKLFPSNRIITCNLALKDVEKINYKKIIDSKDVDFKKVYTHHENNELLIGNVPVEEKTGYYLGS